MNFPRLLLLCIFCFFAHESSFQSFAVANSEIRGVGCIDQQDDPNEPLNQGLAKIEARFAALKAFYTDEENFRSDSISMLLNVLWDLSQKSLGQETFTQIRGNSAGQYCFELTGEYESELFSVPIESGLEHEKQKQIEKDQAISQLKAMLRSVPKSAPIEVKLNKEPIKNGNRKVWEYIEDEKLEIQIESDIDVFIVLDYINAKEQTRFLIPNPKVTNHEFLGQGKIQANKKYVFPKESWGASFKIKGPPFGTEMLVLYVCDQPFDRLLKEKSATKGSKEGGNLATRIFGTIKKMKDLASLGLQTGLETASGLYGYIENRLGIRQRDIETVLTNSSSENKTKEVFPSREKKEFKTKLSKPEQCHLFNSSVWEIETISKSQYLVGIDSP